MPWWASPLVSPQPMNVTCINAVQLGGRLLQHTAFFLGSKSSDSKSDSDMSSMSKFSAPDELIVIGDDWSTASGRLHHASLFGRVCHACLSHHAMFNAKVTG